MLARPGSEVALFPKPARATAQFEPARFVRQAGGDARWTIGRVTHVGAWTTVARWKKTPYFSQFGRRQYRGGKGGLWRPKKTIRDSFVKGLMKKRRPLEFCWPRVFHALQFHPNLSCIRRGNAVLAQVFATPPAGGFCFLQKKRRQRGGGAGKVQGVMRGGPEFFLGKKKLLS